MLLAKNVVDKEKERSLETTHRSSVCVETVYDGNVAMAIRNINKLHLSHTPWMDPFCSS